jgi:hypothetical protein
MNAIARYGLCGCVVGVGVTALWTAAALAIARWPMRVTGPNRQKKFYDVGVKLTWLAAVTPVVFAAGWPGLRLLGVPRAGWVVLLATALTALVGFALRRVPVLWPLAPPVGYAVGAAVLGALR